MYNVGADDKNKDPIDSHFLKLKSDISVLTRDSQVSRDMFY